MRLGAVPYLNAIPLIRGLKIPVERATPAELCRLMTEERITLATAPIAAVLDNPGWHIVPNMAIGTKGSVRSVLLCTQSPEIRFENVTRIALDSESRTSVLLLKVLLALKYGRDLNHIKFSDTSSHPSADVEAKLLIGDKALRESTQPSLGGNIYDLGYEWTQWTKLPFVFACWITQENTMESSLLAQLEERLADNLKTVDEWIDDIDVFDRKLLQDYFTKNMNYAFGAQEQEGLMSFYHCLRRIGLVKSEFELHFVNAE